MKSGEENSPSLREILATNVRVVRKFRGYSQEVLAEKSGLHRTYVSHLERCQRNTALDNVEHIAAALEVPGYQLFNPTFSAAFTSEP